jgi:hypothetical protein
MVLPFILQIIQKTSEHLQTPKKSLVPAQEEETALVNFYKKVHPDKEDSGL